MSISLYSVLKITKTATEEEIRKAYKKQALLWHPDRNPDNLEEADRKFKEISEAYEILGDAEKRRVYDQTNSKNFNIPTRRSPDFSIEFEVSLKELYTGIVKDFTFDKLVICQGCNGTGGDVEDALSCKDCNGQGFTETRMQFGAMILNQRIVCQCCKGTGKVFSENTVCKCCWGSRLIKKKTVLNCHVQPGMTSGDRIRFEGEAHEVIGSPGEKIIPGDLYVVIKEIPHSSFLRAGRNLTIGKTISLKEALCGTTFEIINIDGTQIEINLSGNPTPPNFLITIKNMGMPGAGADGTKGDLNVLIKIEFPSSLTANQKLELSKIL